MSDIVLRADKLTRAYGAGSRRSTVLDRIDLEVRRGEKLFLVGPSGSGKTTLLYVLGCLLRPDAGRLEVLGHEVSGLGEAERTAFRGRHLGFVFQTHNLFGALSAIDNLMLASCARGEVRADAARQARAALEQVGLGRRGHLKPAQLSTGECQRLAIARALAGRPVLLFADEPTASLDAENGRRVMALMADLVRQAGVTLVVVTHDERVLHHADRIICLADGRCSEQPLAAARRPVHCTSTTSSTSFCSSSVASLVGGGL